MHKTRPHRSVDAWHTMNQAVFPFRFGPSPVGVLHLTRKLEDYRREEELWPNHIRGQSIILEGQIKLCRRYTMSDVASHPSCLILEDKAARTPTQTIRCIHDFNFPTQPYYQQRARTPCSLDSRSFLYFTSKVFFSHSQPFSMPGGE